MEGGREGETQLFHLPPRARRRAAPRVATDGIDGVTYLSPSQRSRSVALSLSLPLSLSVLSRSQVAIYLLKVSLPIFPQLRSQRRSSPIIWRRRREGAEGEGGRYAAASKIARASFASTSPRARGMDSWHVKTFAWHDGLSSLARCGHFRRRAERVIYADSGFAKQTILCLCGLRRRIAILFYARYL